MKSMSQMPSITFKHNRAQRCTVTLTVIGAKIEKVIITFYSIQQHLITTDSSVWNWEELENLFKMKPRAKMCKWHRIFTYLSLSTPKRYTPIGPPALRATNPIVG
jgi:hypothetical protein